MLFKFLLKTPFLEKLRLQIPDLLQAPGVLTSFALKDFHMVLQAHFLVHQGNRCSLPPRFAIKVVTKQFLQVSLTKGVKYEACGRFESL